MLSPITLGFIIVLNHFDDVAKIMSLWYLLQKK